jgi:hypothetical protein
MWLERLYDEFTTPHRGMPPEALLRLALIAVGVLVLVVGTVFAAMTGQSGFLAVAFGFLLIGFGAIGILGPSRRRTPDSSANPVCPRCGARPEGSVTANGFTKCAGCGNPYFVF